MTSRTISRTRLTVQVLESREVPATGLGIASDFSAFVLQDLTASNSNIEGRAAAGGDATFTGYALGDKLPNSFGTRDDLIVGGNLSFTNGQVFYGNVVYGGTGTFVSFGIPNGTVRQQTGVINFGQAETDLRALADQYAALPATGTVQTAGGTLRLTGALPGQNIFRLTATQLSNASNLVIQAPAGSSVIVNVSGVNADMEAMGFSLEGVSRDAVILNFSQATGLTLNAVGVLGSVLAPRAAVDFSNGEVHGTLVAASWSGTGKLVYAPPPVPAGNSRISGLVYRDENRDGLPQDWEWREAGVTVTLTGLDQAGTAVTRQATTDVGGIYRFANLPAGTYSLEVTPAAGFAAGIPTTGAFGGVASPGRVAGIVIPVGQSSGGYNFGELVPPTPPVATSRISGLVYRDENRDGLPQDWEWREAGVTVTLTGTDITGAMVTRQATTDVGGIYRFRDLAAGTYTLQVTPAAGFTAGIPTIGAFGGVAGAGSVTGIVIPEGQSSGGYNFGELAPSLSA